MKVYISPSNQPRNKCALGHSEKDHCIDLAARIARSLGKYNIQYKIATATTMSGRVAEAAAWGAKLYLPLHTNATAKGTARGTRFGYGKNRNDSLAVCRLFVDHWRKLYPLPDNVKTAQYPTFTEANKPLIPSVYVELVFHDNLQDATWLHQNMDAAAENLAGAIADFFGVYKAEEIKTVEMPDVKLKLTRQENALFHNVDLGSVVTLPMEEYLLGVVPAEVGNPHLEAAKAQAIAARTYAYSRVRNGAIIDDTTTYQAYRAPRSTNTAYKNAHLGVTQTAGQMLYYNGTPLETAVYSHSNGGQMTSSKDRWGGERAYLINGPDPWTAATGEKKNGHGVGMSQVGAIYAAGKGVSHLDILGFYYPKTEVLPKRASTTPPVQIVHPEPTKYLHTAKVVTRLPLSLGLWSDIRKSRRIMFIPRGATVYVLDEINLTWVKVQYKDKQGYVDRQYLSEPAKNDALYKAKVATMYPLSLGLWETPSKGRRLQYIANGREIEVLKEVNQTWAQVRVGKAIGYVDRKYLKVVS